MAFHIIYPTNNEHEVPTDEYAQVCKVAEYYSLMFDPRNCEKNLCCQVKLEWHSLVFCSLGAIAGMIFGLEVTLEEQDFKSWKNIEFLEENLFLDYMSAQVVDTALTPPEKKLSFVCIWFSFAFALFLLNREHKRKTFDLIPRFGFPL